MSAGNDEIRREFVLFCHARRPVGWPLLYDEMCFVAGHRLFRGMGYQELREAGLDLTLVGSIALARFAQDLLGRERIAPALAT